MNSLPIFCIRGAEPGIGTGCTEGSIHGKSENGKKALLIGILSTVVLLVAVLGLMLVGCTPEQGATPSLLPRAAWFGCATASSTCIPALWTAAT